jgi:hypothetical protein
MPVCRGLIRINRAERLPAASPGRSSSAACELSAWPGQRQAGHCAGGRIRMGKHVPLIIAPSVANQAA